MGLITEWMQDETIKVKVISAETVSVPIVRTPLVSPMRDEIVFGGDNHTSINLWLILCGWTMGWVGFIVLLWMFTS